MQPQIVVDIWCGSCILMRKIVSCLKETYRLEKLLIHPGLFLWRVSLPTLANLGDFKAEKNHYEAQICRPDEKKRLEYFVLQTCKDFWDVTYKKNSSILLYKSWPQFWEIQVGKLWIEGMFKTPILRRKTLKLNKRILMGKIVWLFKYKVLEYIGLLSCKYIGKGFWDLRRSRADSFTKVYLS